MRTPIWRQLTAVLCVWLLLVAPTMVGCSSSPAGGGGSANGDSTAQPVVEFMADLETDADGHVVFESAQLERDVDVSVVNESGEPLQDIELRWVTNGDSFLLIAEDPSGQYAPALVLSDGKPQGAPKTDVEFALHALVVIITLVTIISAADQAVQSIDFHFAWEAECRLTDLFTYREVRVVPFEEAYQEMQREVGLALTFVGFGVGRVAQGLTVYNQFFLPVTEAASQPTINDFILTHVYPWLPDRTDVSPTTDIVFVQSRIGIPAFGSVSLFHILVPELGESADQIAANVCGAEVDESGTPDEDNEDGEPSADDGVDEPSEPVDLGTVQFAAPMTFPAGSAGFNRNMLGVMDLGDLDGDGDLDAAVPHGNNGVISILLNNGDGIFVAGDSVPALDMPVYVIAEDFDQDGTDDLAAIVWHMTDVYVTGFSVSVFLNDGHATFSPVVEVSVDESPQSLGAADLDSDGDLDLAVASGGVSVLLNDGDGTFDVATYRSDESSGFNSTAEIAVLDWDGNGNLDLLTGHTVFVYILRAHGDGTFEKILP